MAPKKKGTKKADDDWEAEALGEALDPIALATQEAKAADVAKDEEDTVVGGGGLIAAIKKSRQNKKKKGKIVEDDFPDGDDSLPVDGANGLTAPNGLDATSKAPEEATADDLFAAPATKGKAAKGGSNKKDAVSMPNGDESEGEGGGVKSKKEKEKEKREREKQRKREQVRTISYDFFMDSRPGLCG